MIFGIGVILIPFLSAAAIPLVDRLFGEKARNIFAVVCGFATAAFALALIPLIRSGSVVQIEWIPNLAKVGIALDALSVNLAVIAGVIGSLIVLYSLKYMDKESGGMRYYALTLLFIGGMIGLVLADNFLTLYIFWEIVGVCSYALIGFFYKDPKAVAAGMKAFITTRIGDVGLLIGILLLYTNTHTFSISETITKLPSIPSGLLATAAFLFLAGAVGKSAQVPLHVWLPDAMEAPTTTSALIHAATMVNAGIYLTARTYPLFSGVAGWMYAVALIGGITAFLAASMGLVEKDLKRVLAYSTVSQLGYMMLSLGVGGLFASQFHLMNHAIFKALLFLSAGAIIHAVGTRNMHEMGGLLKEMKLTAVCFGAGTLALMGIPLFNGFFSKDMIFAASLHSGNMVAFTLAVATAVITVLYSLRMFSLVFLGERKRHGHDSPWQMSLPLVILALGTVSSYFLAPFLSGRMAMSGIHVEPLAMLAFLEESFLSPMIGVTLLIVLAGAALFLIRKYLKPIAQPYLALAKAGFYFDAVYQQLLNAMFAFGKATLSVFDEGILNRFNYALGSGFSSLSQVFRLTHTGELPVNLVGMILGIAFILIFVLWRWV